VHRGENIMKIIPFMKYKYPLFAFSGIIIAIGLIFGMIHGGFNLGIDFTGGSQIWANLGRTFEITEVRAITDKFDPGATVTYAGTEKKEVIVKTIVQIDNVKRAEIIKDFKDKFNVEQTSIVFDQIGPTIGNELRTQAVWALLLATLGILLYVSFRFEWRFGVAGVLALIHDLAILVTVYLVLDIPVNSSFIAAVLTIVGYSINDTIVIFDRIRENVKNVRKYDPSEMADESITQTLARSINTVLTVVICVASLYFFGVPAIKEFALPLLIGIISGCYSSICIASPIWVILKDAAARPKKARVA